MESNIARREGNQGYSAACMIYTSRQQFLLVMGNHRVLLFWAFKVGEAESNGVALNVHCTT
jgi:hypothetical protein